jgi:hypothetical protein
MNQGQAFSSTVAAMRGTRRASSVSIVWAAAFAILLAALLGFAPAARAASPATTIDFSSVGQGPFDQSFFKHEGIVFTEGNFVGFVQGRNALIGPIAGNVRGGFTSLSAQVAPANQGTATYTLAAFKKGKQIASTSMTVTQDEGDPDTGLFGYFTISVDTLSAKADSFSLSNVFVRSSFGTNQIEFGVSSITSSRE